LFEIVAEVEGLAACRAARLPSSARNALVRSLDQINKVLNEESSSATPDARKMFDLDQTFHRTYVEAGAGNRLLAMHDAIKPQSERYIRLYISALADEIGTSVHEHDVTIRAIEAGDQDSAQMAVRSNWRNAADRLSKVIAHLGERGAW
jgi:DNA-binding GntR family transcriptional regulator